MSFKNIAPAKFAAIDIYRSRNRIKLRFTDFPVIKTLIVNIPTATCEAAHRNSEGIFFEPISKMGDHVNLCCMGATTFEHRYRRARSTAL